MNREPPDFRRFDEAFDAAFPESFHAAFPGSAHALEALKRSFEQLAAMSRMAAEKLKLDELFRNLACAAERGRAALKQCHRHQAAARAASLESILRKALQRVPRRAEKWRDIETKRWVAFRPQRVGRAAGGYWRVLA